MTPAKFVFLGCDSPLAVAALETLLRHGQKPQAVIIAGPAPPPAAPLELPVATNDALCGLSTLHDVPVRYSGDDNDTAIAASLPQHLELVVVACLGSILSSATLARARHGFVNVHPSRLPSYRGPAPMFWQLRDGNLLSGVSVHRMDSGIDTGPLLVQANFTLPLGINEIAAEALAGTAAGAPLADALQAWPNLHFGAQASTHASYQSHPNDQAFSIDARDWSGRRAYHFMRGTQWRRRLYTVHANAWTAHATAAVELRDEQVTQPTPLDSSTLLLPFGDGSLLVRGALTAGGAV